MSQMPGQNWGRHIGDHGIHDRDALLRDSVGSSPVRVLPYTFIFHPGFDPGKNLLETSYFSSHCHE